MMRFLLAHLDELGGVANQTIEQLGLLTGGRGAAGGGGCQREGLGGVGSPVCTLTAACRDRAAALLAPAGAR